jgi:PAS domain S-box-containing protein
MFEFWHFKSASIEMHKIIEGDYNYFIVFLSLLVSSFTAYVFLAILEHTWQVRTNKALTLWKVLGSILFGLGIWAMHFTGMLAFMLPITVSFDVGSTLLSVFIPMFGAYISLSLLAKQDFSFTKIQLSALCLALGITSTHFIGMQAMQVEATIHYDAVLYIVATISAYLLAIVAIYLIQNFHGKTSYGSITKMFSLIVMGAAFSCLHYVAMTAVNIYTQVNEKLGQYAMNINAMEISLTVAGIIFIMIIKTIFCALIKEKLLKAELTIEQNAIREKDIVENMADGLLTINSLGIVENINSSGFLMFGYERDALIGCNLQSLMKAEKIQPLSGNSFDSALQDCLGQTFVAQGVKQNGSKFPIEVNFSKISLQIQGRTIFNCVARDITHRNSLEAQLRHSQKLESIGQLSAGIAHEINTPTQYVSDNINFLNAAFDSCLNIIRLTQTITDKDISQITQQELDHIKVIFQDNDMDFVLTEIPLAISQSSEGLQRVKKIIGAMKSFTHTSQGEMGLVDIIEAIESTITVSRSEWRYIANLVTNYSDTLPKLNCLRDEFNQVILNIIVNAAHAIEDKYGKKSETIGCINIDVYQQNNNIQIVIKDDGIGMNSEVKERIFDPFFTTKEVGKGTGQGLSMVYLIIVEKHKGTIEITSQPNEGSTFTITIPIT